MSQRRKARIHTFTSASKVHLEYILKKSEEEVLELSDEMVRYSKKFTDDVEFSAQDCMRADPEFVYKLVRTAIAAGATTINIPDTTGYGTPVDYGALIKSIFDNVPEAHDVARSRRTATTIWAWRWRTHSRRSRTGQRR